jgi:tRNA G10  N-methylase Trm11
MNPMGKERLGYPTQKPEALLKPLILVSTNKNEIVLDPFCGCGTTLSVAQQLGRKWIGIDVSPIACNLMKERLNKIGATDVRIIGAPKTIKELKKLEPFQFQNWVIDRIGGHSSTKKSSDMGIDGFSFMVREPIQIKQSEGIGRNVVDNFETAIRRQHKTTGYIIAFSFGKGAYEEAARAKLEKDSLDIKLVRVDELDKYFPHSS